MCSSVGHVSPSVGRGPTLSTRVVKVSWKFSPKFARLLRRTGLCQIQGGGRKRNVCVFSSFAFNRLPPPPLPFSVLTWGRSAFACQASVSTAGTAAATNMENGTEFPIYKNLPRKVIYGKHNDSFRCGTNPVPSRKEGGRRRGYPLVPTSSLHFPARQK